MAAFDRVWDFWRTCWDDFNMVDRPFQNADKSAELGGWTNNHEEVFEDLVGKNELVVKAQGQYEDVMDEEQNLLASVGSSFKRVKLDLFSSPRLTYPTLECKPRPVGGVGFLKIVEKGRFPKNDFFKPGQIFCIRLRHNNLAFTDEASVDWRVACIKLADLDQGGPLDLIMHTGRVPPYYNADSFDEFVAAFKGGEETFKKWMLKKPCFLKGVIDGSRVAPNTYQDQRYYSHTTFELIGKDRQCYLARLRLVPLQEIQESGLVPSKDQYSIWLRERQSADQRDLSYLRDQYIKDLLKESAEYKLQIQTAPYAPDKPSMINACLPWNLKKCPWRDLGTLTVPIHLPEEVLCATKYDILANHDSCFKPVQPRSSKSLASLSSVLREFHGITVQPIPVKQSDTDSSLDSEKYQIAVKTGPSVNAGTDADVFITLTGHKGRSLPISLDNDYRDDFESGSTDEFEIATRDVGDLIYIQMELKSMVPNRYWHLEFVKVTTVRTGVEQMFPCYHWVSTSQQILLLKDSIAKIPQEEEESFAIRHREFDLAERLNAYEWQPVDNLPSIIKTGIYQQLPKDSRLHFETELDLLEVHQKNLAAIGSSAVTSLLESKWNVYKECVKLSSKLIKNVDHLKKLEKNWKSDEEFGHQFLNGPHPIRIKRVTSLSKDFTKHLKMLDQLLDRGLSLKAEIEFGHVYMLEYPELQHLQSQGNDNGKNDRYITSPKCLLYVKKNGTLVPIAINLNSTSKEIKIWTPKDKSNDWLMAKMCVKMADAQHHHVISYHFQCLMVLEVFAVATLRNLASVHPVYKLIHPHLSKVIAVNVLGRQHLFPENEGMFEKYLSVGKQYREFIQEAYQNFSLKLLHIPTDLENRDVLDQECLPNYHYRDDALQLWKILEKYVRTILYLHYWIPETLEADTELQAWAFDLHENGFPTDEDEAKGVPKYITDLDQLIELVTIIIYTASCRSTALTSGTMDYYSFYPNYPTMILKEPPIKKGGLTETDMIEAMPSRNETGAIIAACFTLSAPGKQQSYLGDTDACTFTSGHPMLAVQAFREDLQKLSEEIEARNKKLDQPYTYLMPTKIPKSMSI